MRKSRIPACGPADAGRTAVDELLLQDAFNLHKPILAICYGVQALNVWLNGSLDSRPRNCFEHPVNHAPGRDVVNAHPIRIAAGSRLSRTAGNVGGRELQFQPPPGYRSRGRQPQSHGVCPIDQVIEAVELDSPSHFVVGVQWHPERTYTASSLSRALFAEFVHAAETWRPRSIEESVATA